MNRYRTNLLWRFSRLAASASAAVMLLCLPASGQTIPNPSFEADTFTTLPGYISGNTAITGWTGSPTNRVGLNPSGGSPFADNGAIPAGNNVAFIQVNVDDTNAPSRLSTTITGLTVGTAYKVTFRANARSTTTPYVKVYIDNTAVFLPGLADGFSVAPVGGSNPYWYVGFEFTATAASQTLAVVNDAPNDQTLLVDDFKIAPSAKRWSVAAWADDTTSGVDSSYLYTHAYSLGSADNTVINDITFTGVAGNSPAVAGRFSTTYLGAGPITDANVLVSGNSYYMAHYFVYGGNVPAGLYQSITLEGLTAGTEYVMTIYSAAWEDPAVGSRWATFSVGDDYQTINQDQFMNHNGIRVSCRYVADANGKMTIKFAPFVPANVSFHVYGFSNREASPRPVPPVIIAQPKGAVVSPDVAVSFKVSATGVPIPTYQWRFKGADIPGATEATYTVPVVTAADAGAYQVVVANSAGSVTSAAAQLTVGLQMINPSFEADYFAFISWPGYVSGNPGASDNGPITGWASLNNHGINPIFDGRSPFADNGAIPNGSQVAFMQGNGAMSQGLTGLTVGGQYYVHYYENGRTGDTAPAVEVKVGANSVVPAHPVPAVRGGNPYYEISSAVFTADATDLQLAFIKSNPQGGDTTALIDNVAIVPVPAGTPPSVGVQPQPMTVYLGQPAIFAGIAQGSLPLSYQWQLKGTPVPGATSNVLAMAAVTLADEGDYTLVVTNNYGSVTSIVARLSLLETIPSLHNTGIDAVGAPLPAASSDPFWTLIANPDGGVLTNATVANDGWPIADGTWLVNNTTSKWIGSRPDVGNATIPAGAYLYRTTLDLTGRDTNTVTITGRWSADDGGTAVFVNGTTVSVPLAAGFNTWTTFTITSSDVPFLQGINTIDFGVNNGSAGPTGLRLEFTKTSARTLPGIAAGVAVPPQGGTFAEGDTVLLSVTGTGTLPLSYQWKKNGADLTGKTDATLTLTSVTTNDSANYTVVVSNPWGSATSAAAAVVIAYRPIPGVFGTGVDANHQLLGEGATDPHYILSVSADPLYPGPAALVVSNTWPIAPAGPWAANGPLSKWIGPRADQNQSGDPTQVLAVGDYTYQTTFDLTGYDLTKVSVLGGFAVDNTVTDVLVNGVSSGLTVAGFGALAPFTITTNLVAGLNTLDFIVNNAGTPGPSALRVDLKGYLNILPSVNPARLQISTSNTSLSISWSPVSAGQKLQSAPAVTGPWSDVASPSNPYITTPAGARMFYRIVQ